MAVFPTALGTLFHAVKTKTKTKIVNFLIFLYNFIVTIMVVLLFFLRVNNGCFTLPYPPRYCIVFFIQKTRIS